jgi:hypothetical protein
MPGAMTKSILLFTFVLGCQGVDGIAADEEAISNANPTSGAAYTLRLTGPHGCTGVALSRHWVITAAHCYDGSPGTYNTSVRTGTFPDQMTTQYNGAVDVYIHPSYVNDDDAWSPAAWDIALVRLRNGGMAAFTGAKVYSGPETPWTSRGPLLDIIGYGWGSDAGGRTECTNDDNLEFGVKRRAHFAFSGSGVASWQGVDAYSTQRTVCHGDSGGPWVLVRNDQDYLVGLSSRSYFMSNHSSAAVRVDPKMQWVQDIANFVTPGLSCPLFRDHRFAQEVDYRACSEQ